MVAVGFRIFGKKKGRGAPLLSGRVAFDAWQVGLFLRSRGFRPKTKALTGVVRESDP